KPLLQYLPGHPLYSDAVGKIIVMVDDYTKVDEYKSFDVLKNKKFPEVFSGVFNYPVVPRNSMIIPDNNYFESRKKYGVPVRGEAWFNSRTVHYFDIAPIPSAIDKLAIKAAPAVYNANGQTIISAIPEDANKYSGFYSVGIAKKGDESLSFADYDISNMVYSLGIINCPIASIA
ncbi:hypothetical protein HDU67_004502, partial [Dinochytrium kinnereticum]